MSDFLARLQAYGDDTPADAPYPVDRWNPPSCGDIDLTIKVDGSWHYNGSLIERPAMVRLFARLLRRDGDAYVLVTPVEKLGITVEDVPFLAVEMTREDGVLVFRTNAGDRVIADAAHPLRFDTTDGFKPYVRVRGGLEARLTRSLAQEIAGLAETVNGRLCVRSSDSVFAID